MFVLSRQGGHHRTVTDEPKRATNLKRHGLDFAAGFTTYPGKQGRHMAIGELDGRIIAVVFKPLGIEALSVISMRPASRKERKAHGK